LFQSGEFAPNSELETVLVRLFDGIDDKLKRPRTDPIYAELQSLHRFQTRSREQKQPHTTRQVLATLTRGKGGHGTITLFALARPAMPAVERQLLMAVGEVMQLLDDYQDVNLDLRNGVRTLATEGELPIGAIYRQFNQLRPAMAAYYGRSIVHFRRIIKVVTWFCFMRRQWPELGTSRLRLRWLAQTPTGVLLLPGDNLVQQAVDRIRPR
jgi:hypothetical protein